MNDIIFDYYRGVEAEQYSFYRIPKMLFTDTIFQDLSCEAKVLYGLMLDRMSLSLKNHWMDEEERVYIIFTVNNICDLMNCGTQKAVRLRKELDVKTGIGLIEKKRLGLGKPNVIYVKNFMIKDEEGEKQQTEQRQSRIVEIEELQDKRQKFLNDENHNSGIVKIINQENAESEVQNSENHNSGMMKMENQVVSETQLKNSENHNSEKRNSENPLDYESKCQEFGKNQEKIIEQKDSIASGAQFKNSENQNSRVVKITNQEFSKSQFKNDENHNSGIVKITTPECPKSQSNNTDINNTDFSENEYSDTESSETDFNETDNILSNLSHLSVRKTAGMIDMVEEMEAYRKIIRENISYECFEDSRYRQQEEVDELVELMVEVMVMPDNSTVRIGGVDKPVVIVKNRFMKVEHGHIEYVVGCLEKNTSKVGNIRAYLLTTLYNSTMTIENYYRAEVNHDMYGGG